MTITISPLLLDTKFIGVNPPPSIKEAQVDVLLAIQHPDLRLAIDLYLRDEPGINVVGMASKTEGLLGLLNTLRVDLLLIDLSLPGRPLADVLAKARELDPPPKIIVLGTADNDKTAALADKVDYFVVKGEPPEQLLEAIRHASSQSGSEKVANGT